MRHGRSVTPVCAGSYSRRSNLIRFSNGRHRQAVRSRTVSSSELNVSPDPTGPARCSVSARQRPETGVLLGHPTPNRPTATGRRNVRTHEPPNKPRSMREKRREAESPERGIAILARCLARGFVVLPAGTCPRHARASSAPATRMLCACSRAHAHKKLRSGPQLTRQARSSSSSPSASSEVRGIPCCSSRSYPSVVAL
ncbi:hypothetical protein OBBRIDRAFT_215701 [Obba rivulosa]|uniref:Uncharacterized protein n=1 Tax=Obba rivulosa TaxID=1052685 RepID=A0A8E2J3R9_9APHY|nr:hypothetical protein OBBRIDRAFT_215701 [Obba rivulosa]